MNRKEAVQRLVDSANGALEIDVGGDGWPTFGTLTVDGDRLAIALYVGVFGKTHRGRDTTERRFQNPAPNRPIEYSSDRLPLLIGVYQEGVDEADLYVGFDASRRFGKRTRYSMFANTQFIEAGLKQGWAVDTNTANETLISFRGQGFTRYLDFRFSKDYKESSLDAEITQGPALLLRELMAMLGHESIVDLGDRLAEELASTPSENSMEVLEMLMALAERERLKNSGDVLDWEIAMSTVAILDDRIGLMLALWNELSPSRPVPHSHDAFVRRVYEHLDFLAREAPTELEVAVFEIARGCETGVGEGDLELFFVNGVPTSFFYESVRAYFEASSESPAKYEDDDESISGESEEEEDIQAQPVNASVDKLQVITIYNLVSRGRLDIEPSWQRKDVWSLKRKRELIKSLILGIPLPSIILHEKEGGVMSIIDGKQRLTAILQFLRNEWKLPTFTPAHGSPLSVCSGAFYSKDGKKSLSDNMRDTLDLRNIPALIFKDVSEPRLRKIFELYNVTGMRLNAAEIRNAVYQSNPIHKVIYVLAGEGDGRLDLAIGGQPAQKAFSSRLRAIYAGSKKRYQGVDFLARYLGYSRAVQRSGSDQFRIPSTSVAINNYFDYQSTLEKPADVAKEFVAVMDGAERFFDIDEERLAFFVRNDKGQRQFNKLVATTNMVAARFLIVLIESGSITESDAIAAAKRVSSPPPVKQQRSTIWDFQARIMIGLRDELQINIAEVLGELWDDLFKKMEYCILSSEDEM